MNHLWQQLMQSLVLKENQETYDRLIKAYSEPHRYYHTVKHIEIMLQEFDKVKELAQRPQEVELAIWFHDAIYKPFSSNNEVESADWCQGFLTKNGLTTEFNQRVYQLIMATEHSAAPKDPDQQLLVDIDLGILGTEADTYQTFEDNVRKEYRRVPWFVFRKKRKQLLQSFLDRDRIYNTDHFYVQLESMARENLSRAIDLL